MSDQDFAVGDVVAKASGEARYVGVVVAVYATARGASRLVVDVAPQGFQMIATPAMLTLRERHGARGVAAAFARACDFARVAS